MCNFIILQNRKECSRRSLRCCSPVPSWRADKEAIYISGASWSRPSAPYSVITAPKKGKQSRSCPGGVSVFPSKIAFNVGKKIVDSIGSKAAAISTADIKNPDSEIKTSEYGSADPSPTDSSQGASTAFAESDPNADYKAQVQKYETEIRKLRKRLKEERQYFKGQVIALQKEKEHMRRYLDKASRAMMHLQKGIDHERRKNLSLR
ncbi:unnamed protein product, partial [Gongylonema pulchrum]|uniref:MICOS complex subunit MIC60 n=1 Tax=Gongylonema pulchrum TaxID=637853 RepID=A0A183D907_9BILA